MKDKAWSVGVEVAAQPVTRFTYKVKTTKLKLGRGQRKNRRPKNPPRVHLMGWSWSAEYR